MATATHNDVIIRPSYPLFDPRQREIIEENLAGEAPTIGDLDKIGIPAGGATMWAVETAAGQKSMAELQAIVIHQSAQRAYWREAYSGGEAEPDCKSNDGKLGYGDPGDSLRDEGKGCQECPLAQWGSDGNKGQACKLTRNLFVLLPDAFMPNLLRLPPSSLKAWRSYVLRLGGTPYYEVVTSLKLIKVKKKGVPDHSVLMPTLVAAVEGEDLDALRRFRQTFKASIASAAAIDRRDEGGGTDV